MYESVKCLRGIQEGTINTAPMTSVVLYCFFKTIDCVRSGRLLLKTKLVARCCQEWFKYNMQRMFKYLAHYWRNSNSAIIMHIPQIAMTILHNRDNSAILELARNMPMKKHLIKEAEKAVKQRQGGIEKMLCTYQRIVRTFALFHGKCSIQYIF